MCDIKCSIYNMAVTRLLVIEHGCLAGLSPLHVPSVVGLWLCFTDPFSVLPTEFVWNTGNCISVYKIKTILQIPLFGRAECYSVYLVYEVFFSLLVFRCMLGIKFILYQALNSFHCFNSFHLTCFFPLFYPKFVV